jgi:hypothetical protein
VLEIGLRNFIVSPLPSLLLRQTIVLVRRNHPPLQAACDADCSTRDRSFHTHCTASILESKAVLTGINAVAVTPIVYVPGGVLLLSLHL